MTRLIVEDLIVGRDTFRLGPLSMTLEGGQTVALIGPNGGGKTTLLKTLAGLIPPIGGAARIEPPGPCAYLPPPGAVSVGFSALHLTALGRAHRRGWSASLSREDRAAARSALEAFGVSDLADRPFDRLSSGQQQLILLARLTLQDAAVCLLDEPLALLDPANSLAVCEAIKALAASGRIIIASTHDLSFATSCDQVLSIGPVGVAIMAPTQALTRDRLVELYGVYPYPSQAPAEI